jgi:hypothetical protein
MDYSSKTGGIHSVIDPMDNAEENVTYIKSILCQYKGKFPDQGIV